MLDNSRTRNRREYLRAFGREWYRKQREVVLDHYGHACACCGTTEQLEIDHVDGGRNKHRDKIAGSGSGIHLYRWLIKNNFPPGFQTLCRPCNRHKGVTGRCWLDHSAHALSYEIQARTRNDKYRVQYNKNRDERTGYRALHLRVREARGRAVDYPCAHADSSCQGSMQWANISGEYQGVDDFMPLCRHHHRRFDENDRSK